MPVSKNNNEKKEHQLYVLKLVNQYYKIQNKSLRLKKYTNSESKSRIRDWENRVYGISETSISNIIESLDEDTSLDKNLLYDYLCDAISKDWDLDKNRIRTKLEDTDFKKRLEYFFYNILIDKYDLIFSPDKLNVDRSLPIIRKKFSHYFGNCEFFKIDNSIIRVNIKYFYFDSKKRFVSIFAFLCLGEINNVEELDTFTSPYLTSDKGVNILFTFKNVTKYKTETFVAKNIYVENINMKKAKERINVIDGYVYNSSFDVNELLYLNLFLDEVVDKVKSYEHILAQDAMFMFDCFNRTQTDGLLPFSLARITESILNFEQEIFDSNYKASSLDTKNILLVGNLSINMVKNQIAKFRSSSEFNKKSSKSNANFFDKIIVMSDSRKYVNWLKNKMENWDEDIEVIIFYPGIANYVLNKYNLYNWADFIVVAGGYASELKNISKYLRIFNFILKDNGVLQISFYESDSLSSYNSRFSVEKTQDYLFSSKLKTIDFKNFSLPLHYTIPCYTFGVKEALTKLDYCFEITYYYHFPQIIMLNNGLSDDLFYSYEKIDKVLSFNKDILNASDSLENKSYYTVYVCEKKIIKIDNIQDEIAKKYNLDIVEHEIVYNRAGHYEAILKTIKNGKHSFQVIKTIYLYNNKKNGVILTAKDKMLPEKSKGVFCINEYKELNLMSEKKINTIYGKNIGNLSPFFKEMSMVDFYLVDEDLLNYEVLYIGTDLPDRSFCIEIEKFKKIIGDYKMTVINIEDSLMKTSIE